MWFRVTVQSWDRYSFRGAARLIKSRAKNDSWWIILSYRFGRGSRRRSHGFVNQSQSNIDGVLGSCLALLKEYLRSATYPTVYLHYHQASRCSWMILLTNLGLFTYLASNFSTRSSRACKVHTSLRRLSLPTFRPHLQAKVSHIKLRHTPPFTLTTTRVGIDASSLSDAASCPNLRARRSPHSISYYKLQIVRYCFPGMPTSAA